MNANVTFVIFMFLLTGAAAVGSVWLSDRQRYKRRLDMLASEHAHCRRARIVRRAQFNR